MTHIKAIATDLDGTVIHADGTISERVFGAFAACRHRGMAVSVATGRIWLAANPRFVRLGQTHTICHGGTVVAEGDRIIWSEAIAAARAAALEQHTRDAGLNTVFFGLHEWTATSGAEEWGALTNWLGKGPAARVEWPVPLGRIKRGEGLAEIQAEYADLHWEPEGEWVYFRLQPADKGTALRRLCFHLGITPAEVLAFGDELNDLPLFQEAGHGVAVGNARPELKVLARRIAPPIYEDGVAVVLEDVLQGRWPT